MSDVLIAPRISDPELDEEDPKEAHYVAKKDWMTGYVEGMPIRALCGKLWVPSRNPENLPVCPICTDRLKQNSAGRGGLN